MDAAVGALTTVEEAALMGPFSEKGGQSGIGKFAKHEALLTVFVQEA
jgi:hypothetical protein